jgi:hypothetical protein
MIFFRKDIFWGADASLVMYSNENQAMQIDSTTARCGLSVVVPSLSLRRMLLMVFKHKATVERTTKNVDKKETTWWEKIELT